MGNMIEVNGKIHTAEDYTVEYCPWCDSEQVIYSSGVTKCPECGKPLAPCSMCEQCVNDCPYGCDGTENDEKKPVTNPDITKEEIEFFMASSLY